MRLAGRDWFATALVGLATLAAVLWAVDFAPPGLDGVRATGAVVLACGFGASAAAVVPGFERLVKGSRLYLVVASLLGLVALAAGIGLLVTADPWWLALLICPTLVLWAMATVRHTRLAAAGPGQREGVRLSSRAREEVKL